jgi:hypothetical protein
VPYAVNGFRLFNTSRGHKTGYKYSHIDACLKKSSDYSSGSIIFDTNLYKRI